MVTRQGGRRRIVALAAWLALFATTSARADDGAAPVHPPAPMVDESPKHHAFLPSAIRSAPIVPTVRTLVLTDAGAIVEAFELAPDAPELTAWRADLAALVAHPAVQGYLVDDLAAEGDAVVRRALASWRANVDPTQWNRKANALATAIRDWVFAQRRTRFPGLRYVVIAGDDRIVPFYRLRIDPPAADRQDWDTEATYFDEARLVGAGTSVGAALAADLALVDDVYATAGMTAWGDGAEVVPLPELAVGRLVERPSDMSAVIRAFLDAPERPLERALLAGYDFMQDGLEAVEPALAVVLSDDRRTRLMGSEWTVDALTAALLGERNDLVYVALHANHYNVETPNNGILTADQIHDAAVDLRGAVAVGLACHAGLNVPGPDHPRPMDFPEAWASRGAALVGSTGWAYGGDRLVPELRYQEVLMARYTELLVFDGGDTLGDALVRAKHDYVAGLEELGGARTSFHAKTIAGTVLYGLPMARLRAETAPEPATRPRRR